MVNGAAMIEAILEHAAVEIGMTPLELRMKNMMEMGDPVMPPPSTLSELKRFHFIKYPTHPYYR